MDKQKLIEHILKSDLTAIEKRYLEELVRKENEIKPKYYGNGKPERRYKAKCTCCGAKNKHDHVWCDNCGARMDIQGDWIQKDNETAYCSECGYECDVLEITAFCPNCFAKLLKGE